MTGTTAPSTPLELALADLPAKLRVHELAKRAGLTSKQALAALAEQGSTAASAASSVDAATATALLTAVLGPQSAAAGAEALPQDEQTDAAATTADLVEPAPGAASSPLFLPPAETPAPRRRRATRPAKAATTPDQPQLGAVEDVDGAAPAVETAEPATDGELETDAAPRSGRRRRGRSGGRGRSAEASTDADAEGAAAGDQPAAVILESDADVESDGQQDGSDQDEQDGTEQDGTEQDGTDAGRRRRRRGRRGRGRVGADGEPENEAGAGEPGSADGDTTETSEATAETAASEDSAEDGDERTGEAANRRRRRRRRRTGGDEPGREDDPDNTVVHVRETRSAATEVQGVRGSTRLEAKRQRRRDTRDTRRRPQILTEAEFLARRESVDRVMAVRQRGDLAQVALLEDGVLVEHFVSRAGSESLMGNIYLGKVQNVLPSMEAAFVDIGRGRNAVLYAGEVNWDAAGLAGKARRIETALSSGDTMLVQVSKDPIGHKGARLTTQISLPGRFVVYVPGGGATGISRKLPDVERKRLKSIMDRIVPEDAGVIIRTAAEGVAEDELARDVERLKTQWEEIAKAAAPPQGGAKVTAPQQLSREPDTLIKVVRDLFNSDISRLVLDGEQAWESVSEYVTGVAPELADRVTQFDGPGPDVFSAFRIDEQIAKALERKVHLPSGGSLVIDRTEAMTVVDVNTGKYTGSGGNLEETVTKNNLEAAEEIVRQLRLRDIGGIIVIDFIDMVLESNRDLVMRRLTECLGRDRTRHQVAEVTSLGLVQMTRKKMGTGLVEAFSEPCPHCGGRGILLHDVPVESAAPDSGDDSDRRSARGRRTRGRAEPVDQPKLTPAVVRPPDPRGPKPPSAANGAAHPGDAAPVDGAATAAEVPQPAEPTSAPAEPSAAEAPAATGRERGRERGRGRGRQSESPPISQEASAAVTAVLAALDARTAGIAAAADRQAAGEQQETAATPVTEPAGSTPSDSAPTEDAPPTGRRRGRRAAGRPAGAPNATGTPDGAAAAAEPAPIQLTGPAVDPAGPEALPTSEPTAESAASPAPAKRRRRAASRPAGPAGAVPAEVH